MFVEYLVNSWRYNRHFSDVYWHTCPLHDDTDLLTTCHCVDVTCDVKHVTVWRNSSKRLACIAINSYESVKDSNKIYSDDRVCPPERHFFVKVIMWQCGDPSWRPHHVTMSITLRLYVTCPISGKQNSTDSILVSILPYSKPRNLKMIKLFMYISRVT